MVSHLKIALSILDFVIAVVVEKTQAVDLAANAFQIFQLIEPDAADIPTRDNMSHSLV